jgi:hypothetical protein
MARSARPDSIPSAAAAAPTINLARMETTRPKITFGVVDERSHLSDYYAGKILRFPALCDRCLFLNIA